MESTNLHQQHQQQQLQDQVVGGSSNNSALASPSFSVGSNDHAWRSPNFLLNNHASSGEATSESVTNSMVQDLGFPNWPDTGIDQSASHHDQHLISNKIKQELSSTSFDHHSSPFPKFSDMLISPSTSSPSEMLLLNTLSPPYKNHMLNTNRDHDQLQLSTFHPSLQYPNHNNDHDNFPSLAGTKGMTTFSQIFPSVNISNLSNNNSNNNSSMSSSDSCSTTMEMNNLQGGLDLFTTARLLSGGNLISQPVPNHLTELLRGSSPFDVDHEMQQSSDLKLWNSTANNLSSFSNNGVPEAKTHSCIEEPKSTHQMASKKPRFESRASCPPLKVRKEKLGDRIAALQQLVAPFGKTDTASVLMEAIGYIKFLQNQVETLSVPYMKLSSHNQSTSQSQGVVSDERCESGEPTRNLRSRGLCLVPLSCMSYLTSDADNGGVWPPPNYSPSF